MPKYHAANTALRDANELTMIVWNELNPQQQAALMQRPAQDANPQRAAEVLRLIEQIRADGDASARALTRRFDGVELAELRVSEAEFAQADSIAEELKHAINGAFERLRCFHAASAPKPVSLETAPGVLCERIVVGIERVGLYVPAGSAPLPSTALMLGVPAMLAGCAEVVLCSPPDSSGRVHPSVLYAARLCGIRTVIKLGGVQAIAAMAFGTQSVPKCDKLFGPGNAWVTQAKELVSTMPGGAAIDMPAGPSEVLVIADASADPEIVSSDLLSQAEHGPDSQVIALSNDAALLTAVESALIRQTESLPRREILQSALTHARLILLDDLDQAIALSNAYAPEHLILNVVGAREYLPKVRNAGSVFIGPLTPESTGDYNAGTNHVLPTYGHARAYSGVSVASFVKLITVQTLSAEGLANIGPEAIVFAKAEGLAAHAQAVQLRLDRYGTSASGQSTRVEAGTVLSLLRPEFQHFKGYSSARMEAAGDQAVVYLNANEAPRSPSIDAWPAQARLNRYPEPQPRELVALLARQYGVDANQLLLGRGSDELIDLLTRGFCRAGIDQVLIMPPTFGMYKICAQVQGCGVVEVPLRTDAQFEPDWERASLALNQGVKLAFICTPNNPTGGEASRASLLDFVRAAAGRAVVIIDEAYLEFSAQRSCAALLGEFDHVLVLRTLSKAHGMAAMRLGCAIARPEVITVLRKLMAPYPIPAPIAEMALAVLSDAERVRQSVDEVVSERRCLAEQLALLDGVTYVWPSAANFLSFRVADAQTVYRGLAARGVIVRDVSHYPGLAQCLRVSIGRPEENQTFLQALTAVLGLASERV